MDIVQERKNLSLSHSDVTTDGERRHDCRRVTPVLNRIGDKWSMQVVMELANGSRRFSELKRALDGVSQRMLTLTLRGLERDGLISRHVTPTIPPRVDYALTDLGVSLREPVKALGEWALRHIDCIHAAQRRYDEVQDEGLAQAS